MQRLVSLVVLALLLAFLMTAAPAPAGQKEDKNSHTGTFVSAKGTQFTMEMKGKEHNHTLAPGAKVLAADGKAISLADLKKGQMLRVTTKEGDSKTATKVEVLKKKAG